MQLNWKLWPGAAVIAVASVAACTGDFNSSGTLDPTEPSLNTTPVGYLDVLKVGPEGTYDFEASESPVTGALLFSTFSVVAGETLADAPHKTIWQQADPADPASAVTITEVPVDGIQVDSINVRVFVDGVPVDSWWVYGTNTVTIEGLDNTTDATAKFFNSETPPMGEGCTPGYWRQDQHFDNWTGYSPTDDYDDTFGPGVSYGGTLLDAVWARGGGVDALARHSVAALLNAANGDIDYPMDTDAVINAVQNAFATGTFESLKDQFEAWNEAGCELD